MLTNKLTNHIYIGQSIKSNITGSFSNGNINNFYEWLSVSDAECSFIISHRKSFSFVFSFEICLHLDDKDMLYFIQKRLGLGKVNISGDTSKLIIVKQQEVVLLLDIFSYYLLWLRSSPTKYLNFLDFKKGFELYKTKVEESKKKEELFREIFVRYAIKKGINTKISDFTIEALRTREFIITLYWLLGFVFLLLSWVKTKKEEEGSFFISKRYNYRLIFSLSQSIKGLDLMSEIKTFLHKSFNDNKCDLNYISLVISKEITNSSGAVQIIIGREDIISNKLIPFFNSMTWRRSRKKVKDYLDWIVILKLKELGLQYTEKGLEDINHILNQMNSNRLSSSGSIKVYKEYLNALIDELLKEPSNFLLRTKFKDLAAVFPRKKDKIYIKSLNRYLNSGVRDKISVEIKDEKGLIVNTFNSISSCAQYYGLSRSTLQRKLHKNNNSIEIIIENKPYNVSIINPDNDIIDSIPVSLISSIPEEIEKSFNNPKFLDVAKENYWKYYLKPTVYIYEKCTNEGFKLIGGFTSSKKAANLLGVSTNIITKYKNSGLIYKDRYKFTSSIR